jgi:hypothetical protein
MFASQLGLFAFGTLVWMQLSARVLVVDSSSRYRYKHGINMGSNWYTLLWGHE